MRNPILARFAVCCSIVAAFHVRLAASSAISEDVPVPGGTAALARMLDIDPVPDRARFLAELTRIQYDSQRVKKLLASAATLPPQGATELVPVPLTAAIWGKTIFRRPIAAENLVGTILSDRRAAFLCHGLAALDDETLEFVAAHPSLLARLYENDGPAFAVFTGGLRIHDGRVVPPGGAAAIPLWEAALDARADQPERFVRELYRRGDGRVAYLYDVIAQLDGPVAAFALGLWIDNPGARVDRFLKLVAATVTTQNGWGVKTFPFARPIHDIAFVLARVRVDAGGRPVLGSGWLWASVFDGGARAEPPSVPARSRAMETIDAAWLAEVVATRSAREREERADQFAFGQRVFGSATGTALPSVVTALRGLPRLRMLMLTLERIGITNPNVYAEAARRLERVSTLDPNRGFVAHAQLQGALALIARMARAHSIDTTKAETLVSTLIAVPLNDNRRYAGAMARWVRQTLYPALDPADSIDGAILTALSGRPAETGTGRTSLTLVSWEGQSYRFDLTAAESRRLRRIREKQGGITVDVAVALDVAAEALTRSRVAAADARAAVAALEAIARDLPPSTPNEHDATPPGVDPAKSVGDVLEKALKDLPKPDPTKDASRLARAGRLIEELADTVLGEALLSLAYAIDLGNPDGSVLLAGDVARRHDFGFGIRDNTARRRVAWTLPKQDLAPGQPWHVSGSLLGLDIALAPLVLRRLNADPVAIAPKLISNERESFAVSVALMDPLALRNADLEPIASAVERGRRRVAALTAESFDVAAAEISMDGWRRRAVRWSLANEPAQVPSMFSMTELIRLGGGPPPASLDAWGMSAYASDGCLCTRFMPPGRWTMWLGRPQLGLIAVGVADLNLHVAIMLRDLQLPAALARHVLTAAVQDFIDQVRPTDADDWLTLVRAAQQVSRERVEDYVASAAADGPLMPERSGGPSSRESAR